jgi:SAM-dependent methyltransferase
MGVFNTMIDKPQFVCANCKGDLKIAVEDLYCQKCKIHWRIREGIPSFTENNFYWNEISKDSMEMVLKTAEQYGWKTALYDVLETKSKGEFALTCDERRADWRFLIPLSKKSSVLDIGSGWGAISIALSESCGTVFSLDATFERVKFLNIRKTQEKRENLFPVHGGDNMRFPFPNNSFDLVSMIGVLEWASASSEFSNPRVAQNKMLQNVYTLLKPGGHIYLGIENRFGYNYLMGRKDHNGLPFVSILPRRLANLVSKSFVGEYYTTYQYSLRGYKNLLSEVGFSNIQFYAPLPQYRSPRYYLPLDNLNAQKYFFSNLFDLFELTPPESRKEFQMEYSVAKIGVKVGTLLRLLKLMKYIVPGFSIIAQK